jgi:hypothetical protein
MAEASEPIGTAERGFESFTNSYEDIFGGVMVVDYCGFWSGLGSFERRSLSTLTVQVSITSQPQTPAPMFSQLMDHMVQKSNPGININVLCIGFLYCMTSFWFPSFFWNLFECGERTAVQAKNYVDFGFLRIAFNLSRSRSHIKFGMLQLAAVEFGICKS